MLIIDKIIDPILKNYFTLQFSFYWIFLIPSLIFLTKYNINKTNRLTYKKSLSIAYNINDENRKC